MAGSNLSKTAIAEIELWRKKFPINEKKPVIIHALTFIQEENGGYLTDELMQSLADYLELPHVAIYEVATFYSMFDLEKTGKHKIYLCTNVSCMLRNSEEIANHLRKTSVSVNGSSIITNSEKARNWNPEVIYPAAKPMINEGGITVVKGNICKDGAVIKVSAASPHLLKHRGRAVVFETIEDYHKRIDDPELDIDETCVMVLKNCGPKGYPGMSEVGNMGLPPKVLKKGITDMVRISDARMSGTAYGTVVLHTSPEAAAGGPLAVVRSGDMIELDVPNRRLYLDISDEELAQRLADWTPTHERPDGGYAWLHQQHVEGADTGADLDFLKGCRGSEVGKDSH